MTLLVMKSLRGTTFSHIFIYLSTICIYLHPFVSFFLAILFLTYFLHTFNLSFILFSQVSDQCHFWGEKSVLQWRWLPDAPETGDNPSEQGEEVGEGRTCLWKFSSTLEWKGWKVCKTLNESSFLVLLSETESTKSILWEHRRSHFSNSYLHFLATLVNQTIFCFILCIALFISMVLYESWLCFKERLCMYHVTHFGEETMSVIQFRSCVLHSTLGRPNLWAGRCGFTVMRPACKSFLRLSPTAS